MQLLTVLAPSANTGGLGNLGDFGPRNASPDFLTLLMTAGLDLAGASAETSQEPVARSLRTTLVEDEPKAQPDEKLPKANDFARSFIIDPQFVVPAPVPLRLSFDLGSAVEPAVILKQDNTATHSKINDAYPAVDIYPPVATPQFSTPLGAMPALALSANRLSVLQQAPMATREIEPKMPTSGSADPSNVNDGQPAPPAICEPDNRLLSDKRPISEKQPEPDKGTQFENRLESVNQSVPIPVLTPIFASNTPSTRTQEHDVPFSPRLTHSFEQSGGEAPTHARLETAAKRTQAAPVVSNPSTPVQASSANSANSKPPDQQGREVSQALNGWGQSGAGGERHDESDRNQKPTTPEPEPQLPVDRQPVAGPALNGPIPTVSAHSTVSPAGPTPAESEPSVSRTPAPEPLPDIAKAPPLRDRRPASDKETAPENRPQSENSDATTLAFVPNFANNTGPPAPNPLRNSGDRDTVRPSLQHNPAPPEAAPASPRTQEQDIAFSLRLTHPFEQGEGEAPTHERLETTAKRTQPAPYLSNPNQAVQTSFTNSADSKSPEQQAQAIAPTLSARGQSGAGSERHDESDRNQKHTSPEAEPHLPVDHQPVASPALDRPIPPVSVHSTASLAGPTSAEPEPGVSRTATLEPPPDTAKAAPLREINLKLPGNVDRPVDIHIVDERGKLHVEVRTSDPQLASSLRDNVGDLVQKLDRSGFRSESTSTHEAPPISAGSAGGNSMDNESGHKPANDHQQATDQGGGGHQGQQHQHGQGRGNRPRWLEEIVRNFHTPVQEEENKQ